MKIVLSGNPLSTQHIYHYTCMGKFPRLYMITNGKDRKALYQSEARNQYKGKVMSTSCDMEITLFFKDKRKRDVDNYNKLVLDSLEGIIFNDDNQVQKLTIKKDYSVENPRIEIIISFQKVIKNLC